MKNKKQFDFLLVIMLFFSALLQAQTCATGSVDWPTVTWPAGSTSGTVPITLSDGSVVNATITLTETAIGTYFDTLPRVTNVVNKYKL